MLRMTSALLFTTTASLFICFLLFLCSFSTAVDASSNANTNKKSPSSSSIFSKIWESASNKQKSVKLAAPARPTSTIPFISRTAITVLQRDLDAFALGTTSQILDIPTRYMWGWGPGLSGYCGETSFQSALLMNGAWVSAERVRFADGDEELLIGVNDEKAGKNLDLSYETYEGVKATGQQYLDKFVKPKLDAGAPSVLGFYELQETGDREYDHIMIIRGYEADSNGGVVGIYYNDFHTEQVRYIGKFLKNGNSNPRFVSTRKVCQTTAAIAQPYDYCIPSSFQYSIALLGLNIQNSAGIYTRATTSEWYEPDWGAEDKLHQTPIPLAFTLIINGNLKKNSDYMVMRFDSAAALKDGSDPLHSSYSWTYNFTHTGEDNEAATLASVTTQMSDGEYWWVTVPRPSN